jgi:hypothetical protein
VCRGFTWPCHDCMCTLQHHMQPQMIIPIEPRMPTQLRVGIVRCITHVLLSHQPSCPRLSHLLRIVFPVACPGASRLPTDQAAAAAAAGQGGAAAGGRTRHCCAVRHAVCAAQRAHTAGSRASADRALPARCVCSNSKFCAACSNPACSWGLWASFFYILTL